MRIWPDLLDTKAPGWNILVGLVVFLPEGVQKLLFPDILGAGRFAKIGIPFPDVMGPFVGAVETICGILIVLGLLTRLATIPLIIIMMVALVSTKLPILVGHDVWMFHLAQDIKRTGFWSMMHEGPDAVLARPLSWASYPVATGRPRPGHQRPRARLEGDERGERGARP